jgi:hypothetical protein
MPYREKTAWLSLAAMAITFVPYIALVSAGSGRAEPLPNVRQLVLFGVTAVLQLLIMGIGYLLLSRQAPDEARTPPDERDRAIMQRSMSVAYYVLMTGTGLVGIVMAFNASGWKIIHAAIFMIVAAEVVRYSVTVASYRRQA